MDLASVVAALASVGVRVSGSTPNNNIQGDSSRACPTGLAGPEPSGTLNDPGQHFQPDVGAVRSGHGAVRGAPTQPTTPMSTRSRAARGRAAQAAPSGTGGAAGVCGAGCVSDAAAPGPRAPALPALWGSPPPPTPSQSPTSSPRRVPHDAASLPTPTRTPGGRATAPRPPSP